MTTMTTPHLLVVAPDPNALAALQGTWRAHGHDVDTAAAHLSPRSVFPGHNYDAVVLSDVDDLTRLRWRHALHLMAPGLPVFDASMGDHPEAAEATLGHIELAWESHL